MSTRSNNYGFLKYIFPFVAFGTLFQAAAINFASFSLGIPVIAVMVFLSVLFLFRGELLLTASVTRFEASYQKYFFPFVLYGVGSAFFFPILFQGLLVYVPRLGIGYVPTGHLELSISNYGEAFYLIFNFFFLVLALRFLRDDASGSAMTIFKSMGFFALIVTSYQLLSIIFHFYYPTDLINSNKSFDQGYDQTTGFSYRLSGLFTEPSLNGNFLGLYFVFFILRSIWTERFADMMYALVFMIATLLVTSSLGYVEIVFGLIVFMGLSFREIIRKKRVKYSFLITGLLMSAAVYGLGSIFQQDIAFALFDKFTSGSYLERSGSDDYAYSLFLQTWGLGVGLGSNRPSGMLTYLLSNVGAIGTILFLAFLFKILSPIQVLRRGNAEQKALMFGIFAFFIGKYFGSPDIAFQYFWLILAIGGAQAMSVRRTHQVIPRSAAYIPPRNAVEGSQNR